MITKEEALSLENIKDGAAVELFQMEMKKVLKNIMDPNTEWKTKRSIRIDVDFHPDENRQLGSIDVQVSCKTAAPRKISTNVAFGMDSKGHVEAKEFMSRGELFRNRDNVVSMEERGE